MIRWQTSPEFMTDAELLAEWNALPTPEHDEIAAEMERRGLDV